MALTQLQPGYRLDRYEVLWPIAHGGMASVYAARMQGKHGFEKLVAIKTILPQLAGDPRLEKMFLDEARIVSGIRHPNVAEIFDVGEQDDILYMIFEWVDGDSLSTLRRVVAKKGSRIPIGIVLRMLADACAGLHAAHELTDHQGNLQQVVHRDVSPQNIMVTSGGTVKVIDFGVAKAIHRLSGETSDAMLKGKVQYMAPEQALGQAADRRLDIWAMGAVLYQLITDRLPYEGDNALVTLHMLMSRMPPAPLPAWVPGPVASVIYGSLAHDPNRRFQSAAEMQTALEGAIQQMAGTVTPTDIARYLSEHLAERIAKRKHTIQVALEAARERDRAGAGNSQSALRVTELNAELAALSSPGVQSKTGNQAISELSSSALNLVNSSSGLSAPGLSRNSNASLAGTPGGVPVPGTSDGTPSMPVPPKRTSRVLVGALAGTFLALVFFGALFAVVRIRGGFAPSVAAAPTPSATSVPPEPDKSAAPASSATADTSSAPATSATAEATASATPPASAPPADTGGKGGKGGVAKTAKPPGTAPPTRKDPIDVFGTR
ncbi:MAG: serine/threonine protein kinase [Deltaproteobacteria bacterium]|nr:serine/threonine protein kinase [Deltaproteobacteria bacterium]